MSFVDFQVKKVGNIGTQSLDDDQNGFSSGSGSNLKLEVPSYGFLSDLSRRSSKSSSLGIFDSVLGVSRGLINFPVIGDV